MDNVKIKEFSIFKVGYTAGVYGCSGEYYKVLVTYENFELDYKVELDYNIQAIYTNGQYIRQVLKDNGFSEKYISIPYTQLKKKDLQGWDILHESDVINELKKELNIVTDIKGY
jgi:hypothetical protein